MDCPDCADGGCGKCEDGFIKITRCPLELITPDVYEMMELAELYEKGLPPISGGALDQTASFTAAARLIWRQQQKHKARNRCSTL